MKQAVDTRAHESGQAILEYVMLLAIVVGLFVNISKLLASKDWFSQLTAPITKEFRYTYNYGHPSCRGIEDGGQKNLALHTDNFRIFINPPTNR